MAQKIARRDVLKLGGRLASIAAAQGAWLSGVNAQDVRTLHALDRRQPRLHDADQVVGDLVILEDVGAEAQVARCELRVGGNCSFQTFPIRIPTASTIATGFHNRAGRKIAAVTAQASIMPGNASEK